MKKTQLTLGAVLALTLIVTTTSGVLAQGRNIENRPNTDEIRAERAANREAKQQEIEARRAELQEKQGERTEERAERESELIIRKAERTELREDRAASREATLTERRTQRLLEFADTLTAKVSRYHERLSLLSEKLALRISELSDRGLDTSTAEAELVEADDALESAYTNALLLIERIASTDVSDRETFGAVVSQVKELKNPFREVVQEYKDVVAAIRAELPEEGTNPDATASATPTVTPEATE